MPSKRRRKGAKALTDIHIKPRVAGFLRLDLGWTVEEARLSRALAGRDDPTLLRHAQKNGQIFITEDGGVPDQTSELWGRVPGIIVLPEADGDAQVMLMPAVSVVIRVGLKNHPRTFEDTVSWPGSDGILVRDSDGSERLYSWQSLNILEPFGPI